MPFSESMLSSVVVQALSDTAFMFATPADANAPRGDLRVRIAFDGPSKGIVELATNQAFGEALAANLLGLEADDPSLPESSPQAVLELSNILAGLLVASAWGSGARCTLGIPAMMPKAGGLGAPLCAVSLEVDDLFPLWVAVTLD